MKLDASLNIDPLPEVLPDECLSLEEYVRNDDGAGCPAWRAWIAKRTAA